MAENCCGMFVVSEVGFQVAFRISDHSLLNELHLGLLFQLFRNLLDFVSVPKKEKNISDSVYNGVRILQKKTSVYCIIMETMFSYFNDLPIQYFLVLI